MVPDILLKEQLSTASARCGPGFMPALLLLSVLLPPTALCSGPDILGLQLGMKQSEVRELFSKSSIPLSEIDPQHLSAPRPLGPLEEVREVRLSFDRGRAAQNYGLLRNTTTSAHRRKSDPDLRERKGTPETTLRAACQGHGRHASSYSGGAPPVADPRPWLLSVVVGSGESDEGYVVALRGRLRDCPDGDLRKFGKIMKAV